jgi:hypothetical protein
MQLETRHALVYGSYRIKTCYHAEKHVAASGRVIHKLELSASRFQAVIPDCDTHNPKRMLVCTPKIGHDLRQERQRRNGHINGNRVPRAAVSLSERRNQSRAGTTCDSERDCVGAGRARQHGGVVVRASAAQKSGATTGPVDQTVGLRQPGDWVLPRLMRLNRKTLLSLAFAGNPEPRWCIAKHGS